MVVVILGFCALLFSVGCPKTSSNHAGNESSPSSDIHSPVEEEVPVDDEATIAPTPAEVSHGVTPVATVSQARGLVPFSFAVLRTGSIPRSIWVLSTANQFGPGVHLVYGDESENPDYPTMVDRLNLLIWKPPPPLLEPGWSEDLFEGEELPVMQGTRSVKVGGLEAAGNEKLTPFDGEDVLGDYIEPAWILWYDGDIQYKLQGTFDHTLDDLIDIAESID